MAQATRSQVFWLPNIASVARTCPDWALFRFISQNFDVRPAHPGMSQEGFHTLLGSNPDKNTEELYDALTAATASALDREQQVIEAKSLDEHPLGLQLVRHALSWESAAEVDGFVSSSEWSVDTSAGFMKIPRCQGTDNAGVDTCMEIQFDETAINNTEARYKATKLREDVNYKRYSEIMSAMLLLYPRPKVEEFIDLLVRCPVGRSVQCSHSEGASLCRR